MYIDSYNYTNRGKYPVNEDSLFCGDNVFVVADGLGGHGSGNVASACAVQYIAENYRSAQEIPELISGVNTAVRRLDNGSRSTVAAAFVKDGNFYFTNVGDSRVYFFRNGRLLCRTKDHSVCQAAVDSGTMSEDDIRGHEDRSKLLKVLGEKEQLKASVYDPIPIRNGDAFLICSDGFWDHVYETEAEIDLLKSDSAKRWGEYMLRRHLKRSRCEDDNFTLICGIIHKEEDALPQTYSPVEIPQVVPVKAKSGSKPDRRLIIGFVAGVLICAVICAAGFMIFGNRNENTEEPSDFDTEIVTSTTESGTHEIIGDKPDDTSEPKESETPKISVYPFEPINPNETSENEESEESDDPGAAVEPEETEEPVNSEETDDTGESDDPEESAESEMTDITVDTGNIDVSPILV